jgi:hypothetical protein
MRSTHVTFVSVAAGLFVPPLLATLFVIAATDLAGPGGDTFASVRGEPASSPHDPNPPLADAAAAAIRDLLARHGDGEADRIEHGVAQVRRYWREEDGNEEAFRRFVLDEFLPRGEMLDATFRRFEETVERVDGYHTSMIRDLRRGMDLEIGPLLPLDRRLGAFDPSAHLSDDLFGNKIAFVALLNFPVTTLQERLAEGGGWSRREWAEARLAQRFSSRVPADVSQEISRASSEAGAYIAGYNIYMHHVLTADGKRLFPEGLRLISHWNLRDELKARYAVPGGLEAQRTIQKIMEAIVLQEIPAAVIDNPLLDWTPETNDVVVSSVRDAEAPPDAVREARNDREPDERYRIWLQNFHATRLADPYFPDNPTLMDRRFNVNREIPESEVEALFEAVLSSPLRERAGRLIEKRLGRPLEPFDIWYAGFRPGSEYQESELDGMTRKRYPSADAYAADIPRMLGQLGFAEERARFLADHIVVEPSRGVGHAFGAARRDDNAHLRTRVGQDGMDYKGYHIAVHEMGHNVEQVFSLTTIDHTLLQGVPNTAFTEALAFVFQARDLELLGLGGPGADSEHMGALENFWATREIAAVGLVDMKAWRWLYENPDATPARFREAVAGIAGDVWNRYFAPVFGKRDVSLLAIYSHMIARRLYTPDYPLGHLIAIQIEEHFKKHEGPLGAEFERICKLGAITPDAWMRQAVGAPLSAEPLLKAAARALDALGG